MEQKKGILFDLDGTLINTYENINFKLALNELKSVQKTLVLKVLKSRVKSFSEMEQKIMEGTKDTKEGEELVRRIFSFLLEHYDNAPLKNGAKAFLAYLKENDYKICLCTNNATDVVTHILQQKEITSYFDYIITSQQVTKSKPDPQMYNEALINVGLNAADCIVFEDTENGILAAQNAGLEVIIVNEKEKRKFNDYTYALMIKDFADKRLYKLF